MNRRSGCDWQAIGRPPREYKYNLIPSFAQTFWCLGEPGRALTGPTCRDLPRLGRAVDCGQKGGEIRADGGDAYMEENDAIERGSGREEA